MSKLRLILMVAVILGLALAGCSGHKKDELLEKVEPGAKKAKVEKKAETAETEAAEVTEAVAPKAEAPAVETEVAARTHPIRNPSNPIVSLETSMGTLTLELFRDVAPAHADSFLARCNDGFYNQTIFHRIVRNFMVQGGDPTGSGTGDAGYNLDAEFSDLPHIEGTLSMARAASPNSASCQFFICFRPTPQLDGQYTIFGQLLKGYEALHEIENVRVTKAPHGELSKPVENVILQMAYRSDADGNPL